MRKFFVGFCILLSFVFAVEQDSLRSHYPDIKVMETADFLQQRLSEVVIDVRSANEYKVAHISGAISLPLYEINEFKLKELELNNQGKLLIFYCTSTSCGMGFRAAEMSKKIGINNIAVFDEGFYGFIKTNPELFDYYGNPLSQDYYDKCLAEHFALKDKIISKEKFDELYAQGYRIVDISRADFSGSFYKTENYIKLSFENLRSELTRGSSATIPNEKMLFIDNFGKEAIWLEDLLVKSDRKDYFFFAGGVRSYLK